MRGRVIAGIVAALLVALVIAGQLVGGDDGDQNEPAGGFRSGAAEGVGAWAAVLRHEGVRLQVREVDPDRLRLLPGTTYLFAEELLDGDTAERVAREVRRGARVVATGRDARSLLGALGAPVAAARGRDGDAVPARRTAETTDTGRVERTGVVWATPPARLRPLLQLRDRRGSVVAGDLAVGRGSVVLVPDRGIVENAGIREADNAAFAVAIAGRGKVVALRPADASAGGLPGRVVLVVLLIVLAAATALVARGRRLGPALQPDEEPTPGRSGYVDALAAVLARTSDRSSSAERLRSRGRTILARRVGLGPDPSPDEVLAAARLAGLTDDDAAALAGTAPRTPSLEAVGRALARLEGAPR